jgi:hypothetical protein
VWEVFCGAHPKIVGVACSISLMNQLYQINQLVDHSVILSFKYSSNTLNTKSTVTQYFVITGTVLGPFLMGKLTVTWDRTVKEGSDKARQVTMTVCVGPGRW